MRDKSKISRKHAISIQNSKKCSMPEQEKWALIILELFKINPNITTKEVVEKTKINTKFVSFALQNIKQSIKKQEI